MDSPPYIATELLELIIDELGAEAEPLPTSSAAFQTPLSLSLTSHRARPRCQPYLFSVLTFDSPDRKGRVRDGRAHLQMTLEMLDANPHFAAYVRRLKISFHRAFQLPTMIDPVENARLDAELESMLPRLLEKIYNIVVLSFDAYG